MTFFLGVRIWEFWDAEVERCVIFLKTFFVCFKLEKQQFLLFLGNLCF